VGGRHDHYDFGPDRFTPRIGLVWDLSPVSTLKLLYGESFRVPNLEERRPAEVGIMPNPRLEPETNHTYELVAEHRFGPVWRLEAHAYHIVSSDLITTVPVAPGSSTLAYANAQEIITEGFDLGAATFPPGCVCAAPAPSSDPTTRPPTKPSSTRPANSSSSPPPPPSARAGSAARSSSTMSATAAMCSTAAPATT
jgi:hypothetical protein